MLALLAAAALAAAPQTAPSRPAVPPNAPVVRDAMRDVITTERWRRRGVCGNAARMLTSYEPTLLFRPQDRDAARPRKLKDLPPAVGCLVGSVESAEETGR